MLCHAWKHSRLSKYWLHSVYPKCGDAISSATRPAAITASCFSSAPQDPTCKPQTNIRKPEMAILSSRVDNRNTRGRKTKTTLTEQTSWIELVLPPLLLDGSTASKRSRFVLKLFQSSQKVHVHA